MIETLHRPPVESRERHHLAADAFLSAALIFLVVIGVQEGLASLMARGELGTWTPPVWLELIGALGIPLAVIGGPLLAWRLYGRPLSWQHLVAGVAGAVAGAAALAVALGVLVRLNPLARIGGDTEGPWLLVIVAALAAVAFLAKPVATAVRDLAGPREHQRRHLFRLAIVAVGLVAIAVSILIGGEAAELGLFALLPAVPAAFVALAVDWWDERA